MVKSRVLMVGSIEVTCRMLDRDEEENRARVEPMSIDCPAMPPVEAKQNHRG